MCSAHESVRRKKGYCQLANMTNTHTCTFARQILYGYHAGQAALWASQIRDASLSSYSDDSYSASCGSVDLQAKDPRFDSRR